MACLQSQHSQTLRPNGQIAHIAAATEATIAMLPLTRLIHSTTSFNTKAHCKSDFRGYCRRQLGVIIHMNTQHNRLFTGPIFNALRRNLIAAHCLCSDDDCWSSGSSSGRGRGTSSCLDSGAGKQSHGLPLPRNHCHWHLAGQLTNFKHETVNEPIHFR